MVRAALLLTTCVMGSLAALAAEGTVSLPGKAVIGPESRTIAMAFGCTTPTPQQNAIGVLSISFEVPNFEALAKRFDFDAFDGPAGTRKPLTEITVGQGVRLPASGHIVVDGTSFHLGVNAALRGETAQLGRLRSLASAAIAAPGSLRWRQESPRKGDDPILVTVPISSADAERIKTALAPCLKTK